MDVSVLNTFEYNYLMDQYLQEEDHISAQIVALLSDLVYIQSRLPIFKQLDRRDTAISPNSTDSIVQADEEQM